MNRHSDSHQDVKPASDARTAANRINASKSTGPKTAEGKERSRRNALKHGLAATMIDGPGLDVAAEAKRIDEWMPELNPQAGDVERYMVEQAVRTSFRLERCDHAQKALIAAAKQDLEEGCDDPSIDDPIDRNSPADQFRLVLRYEMQAERTLIKLVKELRDRAATALAEGFEPRPIAVEPPARNEPKPPPSRPIVEAQAFAYVDIAVEARTNPPAFEFPAEIVHTEAELRMMKRYAPELFAEIEASAGK